MRSGAPALVSRPPAFEPSLDSALVASRALAAVDGRMAAGQSHTAAT